MNNTISQSVMPLDVLATLSLNTNEVTQEQYASCVSFANVCAAEYYTEDNNIIEDAEYDQLFKLLLSVEALHSDWTLPQSPTQRVGDRLSTRLSSVAHKLRMLSLDNAFSNEDVLSVFAKKANESDTYSFELKYDGLAISLIYVNGVYTQALTRGDKEKGEDVTHTVRTIKDIPMVLKGGENIPYFEVRGEVCMSKAEFNSYNEYALQNGLKPFKTARNGASGTIRQLDPKMAASRKLMFNPYGLGYCETGEIELPNSHSARLDLLKSFGFRKNKYNKHVSTIEELFDAFAEIQEIRADIEFDIDGTVFKFDNVTRQEEIGYTNRIPLWAIARKFPAMEAKTTLRHVDVQVGRSGIITPVGKIPPTECGGVSITSITLHHFDKIEEAGLCYGDEIVISRRGDVIPHFEKIYEHKGGAPITRPTHCPECGADTITKDGLVGVFCSAPLTCPAQAIEAICHYVGKKQMNIDGVGEKMIQGLFNLGLIKNVLDLYKLTDRELAQLPRSSAKTAQKALDAIEKSKECRLDKFVNGIGIPGVGESTANDLVMHFGSLDAIMTATVDQLIEVNDIGETIAGNITTFFGNDDNINMINGLIECGITFQEREIASNELEGQVWVVTGTLTNFDKNSIKEFLMSKGAKVTGSVSKKTHVVLYGEKAGSKLTKAQDLLSSGVEIKILNEEQFMQEYA